MDTNDVELFSTTDFKAKDKVVSILVRHRVSYLERWEKVSLLKRREYGGAKELCVIYVNGNQYDKAKMILDEFNQTVANAKKARRRKKKAEAERMKAAAETTEQTIEETQAEYESDNDIDEGIDSI